MVSEKDVFHTPSMAGCKGIVYSEAVYSSSMHLKVLFHPAPSEPGMIMPVKVNSCLVYLQTVSAELATTKTVCEPAETLPRASPKAELVASAASGPPEVLQPAQAVSAMRSGHLSLLSLLGA